MTEPTRPAAKILIVDDQASNIRLLQHTLTRAGYTAVSSTTDPRTVAELHAENRYDLILLDLQMPEMDGFEVLEKLAPLRVENPVAVLVISAGVSKMPDALKAGGDGFLAKPFLLPDVVERVEDILKVGMAARPVMLTVNDPVEVVKSSGDAGMGVFDGGRGDMSLMEKR